MPSFRIFCIMIISFYEWTVLWFQSINRIVFAADTRFTGRDKVMTIIELNGAFASFYAFYLGEDMAENLAREYYRGIAVTSDDDGTLLAGIVWEYHNIKIPESTESVIKWLRISDTAAAEPLFKAYTEKIREFKVPTSRFVIPVKEGRSETVFLKKAGFSSKLTEGDDIIVSLAEMIKMPLAQKKKVPERIRPIREMTPSEFKRGITKCVLAGKKGLCEDLSFLPVDWFEPDVSSYVKTDDEIGGYILFHKMPSGLISIQLMIAFGEGYQQNLIGMMRRFIFSMKEKYPEDTKILLDRHNQASLQLTEKLFPRGFGRPIYTGERKE